MLAFPEYKIYELRLLALGPADKLDNRAAEMKADPHVRIHFSWVDGAPQVLVKAVVPGSSAAAGFYPLVKQVLGIGNGARREGFPALEGCQTFAGLESRLRRLTAGLTLASGGTLKAVLCGIAGLNDPEERDGHSLAVWRAETAVGGVIVGLPR